MLTETRPFQFGTDWQGCGCEGCHSQNVVVISNIVIVIIFLSFVSLSHHLIHHHGECAIIALSSPFVISQVPWQSASSSSSVSSSVFMSLLHCHDHLCFVITFIQFSIIFIIITLGHHMVCFFLGPPSFGTDWGGHCMTPLGDARFCQSRSSSQCRSSQSLTRPPGRDVRNRSSGFVDCFVLNTFSVFVDHLGEVMDGQWKSIQFIVDSICMTSRRRCQFFPGPFFLWWGCGFQQWSFRLAPCCPRRMSWLWFLPGTLLHFTRKTRFPIRSERSSRCKFHSLWFRSHWLFQGMWAHKNRMFVCGRLIRFGVVWCCSEQHQTFQPILFCVLQETRLPQQEDTFPWV